MVHKVGTVEIMFIDFVDLASHEDLNLIMGPI